MESSRCTTIEDLNKLVISGELRPLIRYEEAMHEMQFCRIAEDVCQKGAVVVMLSGPSSSGKTTSANRLATQLRVHGKEPVLMSLDDYYIDRDKIAPGPDGKLDLEHINTIDTELFARNMQDVLAGALVEIPTFNFKTGKREWNGHFLRLEKESVIIVEGLHALNPVLLPKELDPGMVFRMYVCPQLSLKLDDENRIPSSYLRLLRRIVRDYESRGTSVQRTVAMWDSVRQGEKRWIFPFQEQADEMVNTALLFELATLRDQALPVLEEVPENTPEYTEAYRLRKFLSYFKSISLEGLPPTSLLREFLGGSTFKY